MTDLIARRSFRDQAVPASIEAIHELLEDLWEDASFVPDLDRMTFATAVIEAATNIVHACRPGVAGPRRTGHRDRRQGAAPAGRNQRVRAADPQLGTEAKGMPGPEAESGRGLALIRALVTTVTFVRQDGTNTWVLSRDSTPHP